MSRLLLGLTFLAGVAVGCTGLAALEGRAQAPEVVVAIETAAARYGLAPRFLYCLAWHESRFIPAAYNSRGGYAGLFQFSAATWRYGSHLAGLPHTPCYNAAGCDLCLPTRALLEGLDQEWDHPHILELERTARALDAAAELQRDVAAQAALDRDRYRAAVEDALIHFAIAAGPDGAGLPVDWRYVALRMAEALDAVMDGRGPLGAAGAAGAVDEP